MDVRDLEAAARGVLPADVYDYIAGGAFDELTLAANLDAWAAIRLRPRVFRDVSKVDLTTSILGVPVSCPIAVAPMAAHGLAHADAEPATVKGATNAGVLSIVSTRAGLPIDDIAPAFGGEPWWFQVYVMQDRGRSAAMIERAIAGGATALVLTADTPVVGRRLRDVRNGFTMTVPTANRPTDQDPSVTFDDIAWLRDLAGEVPIVIKGVLRADDASRCVNQGAAAIAVSNHGGRQLDGAQATADALSAIVDAVGGQVEVYVDGGIRRGTDVVKALALGARAVFVGRPVMWALATGGAEGVEAFLNELREELALAMALCGCPSIHDVTSDMVTPPRA
jgi:4-hydroxymandelate oxidase